MKELLLKDILRVTNGKLLYGDENTICEDFCRDTREIKEGEICLKNY